MLENARNEVGLQKYDKIWEKKTARSYCGDEIVARAFLEAGVPITGAWPIVQGETISTVDFTRHHCCSPALTLHQVSSLEVNAMWQFESEWVADYGWSEPCLYRDIFDHFIDRHISVDRSMWNNLSYDKNITAPELKTDDDEDGIEDDDVEDFHTLAELEQKAVKSEELLCRSLYTVDGHDVYTVDVYTWTVLSGQRY